MDESMQAMVDSVKAVGVQTPAVVRQKADGRYELISGHRRKMASKLADIETLPCIVREMSHDEATISMVDANLQRETILPSEKAKSYKMKLDAMKRQGQRTDLTSVPVGPMLRTNEEVAQSFGESATQIKRYIRLTELIPQILQMVDEGKIPMRPAVELSYLLEAQQQVLRNVIEDKGVIPSHDQAVKIRESAADRRLTKDVIVSIMQDGKPAQVEHFKMPRDRINRFFPAGTPAQTIEETIIKALELLHKSQQ